jgi:TolA-binding protein
VRDIATKLLRTTLALGACLFIGAAAINAQTATATSKTKSTSSSANLIKATQEYKASSTQLLALQQNEVNKAAAKLADLRTLVSEGLVAKATLEEDEQKLATLRAQLQATQKQIADSDNMIAEITAEEELAKRRPATPVKLIAKQYGAFSTTGTILRYNGISAWSLAGLGEVQAFFSNKFGRSLPTSALGQSATHNRLGYDHRNAVDVALHPDSFEGQALISYLQSRGIPFLAFRGAIPGVATGPHIHIGSPSHRLS